jgi:indolepyruvate ferredoxin oxidoreductase alpha subunit
MGVNGGMVVVSADEPGQHSSQNEQDNRNYAKFAKMPMLEPADSQECKDMIGLAFEISERFDTPVLFRMTTRVCHSKGIVECAERREVPIRHYKKDVTRTVTVPALARVMRVRLEERLARLKEYSETCPLNRIEWGERKTGVIASGLAYYYAKEVFGDSASYLKLGFTYPLPEKLIREFCSGVENLYVIEENDPILEEAVRMLGFAPHGRDTFPFCGELTPDVLRKSLYGETFPSVDYDRTKVVPRPPMLCAGCPHRGLFYELGKRKNVMVSGDIGCYTLGFSPPYNAMDCNICMGASISAGHGAQQIFSMQPDSPMRVVAVIGDSTFFHTGVNSLLDVVYNGSKTVTVILDNRITGMTGHQENPGSGLNIRREKTNETDIEALVRALGVDKIRTVNPNELKEVRGALDWALSLDEPSVIITRWPCVLKKFSEQDKTEFPGAFREKMTVSSACIGCRICLKCGCPALSFDGVQKKAVIDRNMCVGCGVCVQVCPKSAIVKEEK